jgi:hypothetical protein
MPLSNVLVLYSCIAMQEYHYYSATFEFFENFEDIFASR